MFLPQRERELADSFVRFAVNIRLPACCVHCGGAHIVWNGWARRTATFRRDDDVVYLPDIAIRRVRCQDCRRSWQLRPPGVMPQRHYQLCVVAEGVSGALFEGKTVEETAEDARCSRWTVSRWFAWLAGLATPADLQARLVDVSSEPLFLPEPELRRTSRSPAVQAILGAAAVVLVGVEALGAAAGCEPPGLRAVVEALVANRYRHTTYAEPSIPEFAQFCFGGRFGIMRA